MKLENNNDKNTVMNSSKVKTQNNERNRIKNITSLMAVVLAMITIFQASAIKPHKSERMLTALEADTISEIQASFAEEDVVDLEEFIIDEVESNQTEEVKVFDGAGELIAAGVIEGNDSLRNLVNQANYLSTFGGKKYYQIVE